MFLFSTHVGRFAKMYQKSLTLLLVNEIRCTSPHVFHLCSIAPAFPVYISLCVLRWFIVMYASSLVLVIPLRHLHLS